MVNFLRLKVALPLELVLAVYFLPLTLSVTLALDITLPDFDFTVIVYFLFLALALKVFFLAVIFVASLVTLTVAVLLAALYVSSPAKLMAKLVQEDLIQKHQPVQIQVFQKEQAQVMGLLKVHIMQTPINPEFMVPMPLEISRIHLTMGRMLKKMGMSTLEIQVKVKCPKKVNHMKLYLQARFQKKSPTHQVL